VGVTSVLFGNERRRMIEQIEGGKGSYSNQKCSRKDVHPHRGVTIVVEVMRVGRGTSKEHVAQLSCDDEEGVV
jgi:stalled ribosome alternative rescue factor ArfA